VRTNRSSPASNYDFADRCISGTVRFGQTGSDLTGYEAMAKWFWNLFWILVVLAFIIPNPEAAGAAVGNAISAFFTFFVTAVDAATT
jgi:hypothetical protein